MFAIIWPLRGAYGRSTKVSGSGTSRISPTGPYVASGARKSRLVNDCMPFTSPIPLCIRRASAPMWVLLPRMTPPLSQYRKRTSWTPRSFASLTICSGVMGVSRSRWLRRRHLLRDHFGPEGEGTVLDGDDRHALLRDMGVRRERDRPGDPREVLRGFDGGLHRGRIGATGALDRVCHQIHGVVPEGGERVLGVVPVFGLVVGDEL